MKRTNRLQSRGPKIVTLNNVIFPIWLILFFPPVILITLAGNFIIDLVVLLICFYIYKLGEFIALKELLRKGIWKVWIFGFLADMLGAGLLLIANFSLPYEWVNGIMFDPFSHPASVLFIVIAILLSSTLIFLLNYRVSFIKLIPDKALRLKSALLIAIVTAPWTFLLPTKWFSHGF